MDKMFTFLMIISGLSLLFAAIGVPTVAGNMMNLFGLSTGGINFAGSQFSTILGLLSTLVIATVALGFVTRVAFESFIFIKIGLVGAFILGIGDFASIITYAIGQYGANSLAAWFALLLLGPLYIGYCYTIIQAWRGTD